MMTAAQKLAYVKSFLRLEADYTQEDVLISSLITASEQYIKNGTGVTVRYQGELEKLAVALLCCHLYENREVFTAGKIIYKLPFSLQAILFQLKYGGGTT